MGMAAAMGLELLTGEKYLDLQKLGEFDAKRLSWLVTPADFRTRDAALWGGRSYGRVFIGCNGAESYHQVRGLTKLEPAAFGAPFRQEMLPERQATVRCLPTQGS